MSRVGDKIRKIREENNISKKQLAKKLGVSEKFITEVEIGKKIINQQLIDRIGKALGKQIDDITMSFEEETFKEEETSFKYDIKNNNKNEVWKEAFGSILKDVPIYKYDLNKILGTKKLPVIDNKIEGHNQDKVFYLQIDDDDMIGFRIFKGDIAFSHIVSEIDNNCIYLLEYKGERKIRQVRRLDSNKYLLISNSGAVRTETLQKNEMKVIAKLIKLEITL